MNILLVDDDIVDRAAIARALKKVSLLLKRRPLVLAIIAEGVETKEHVDLCKRLKIQRAQGYFYSRPKSSQDIVNTYISQH
jgi:EAL domain-containing protein (putative c-di-GMP-specific phosphodiesterase class I)